MQNYQLEIERKDNNKHVVRIHEKQYGLWICIGSFQIIDQKLFLEDKHNYWKEASDLTDDETFFALSIERFQHFFKIAILSFSETSIENPSLFYVFFSE